MFDPQSFYVIYCFSTRMCTSVRFLWIDSEIDDMWFHILVDRFAIGFEKSINLFLGKNSIAVAKVRQVAK
jgi:hypothetical protein